MKEKASQFGKWCRKLRIDKGWSMNVVAEKLGKKQNHISQIEQGKANPSPEFLKKCLSVYEIPEAEKADFLAQALESSNRIVLELDKISIIPKGDLAKLLAVILFNLHEPYPATEEWNAVAKALKRLFEGIYDRNSHQRVIRLDD
jgi:transcriptional regulator with XRE-family HTH domain